ncbi:hypothetical protein CGRA01v4_13252 [Colletotrichum graminicola]|uniref:C2H2-type domain-containing protein n=1 Tax=Colletotrichum graminicola (strain M1.001 / M2 / FGSC 10212) TaxID=645133 RepID=E3QQG2_COLGM|nr:uncharacterized protein GLRG_08244 [Colletotrichum graminicola M1.001]EFQ33100.1 hypothetical protein GLRG_08244 [Colletotrichum graminicola M1.001]WDK21962.1 hypothetical protein CGRA01v4_13252 [Colletotrichum graminicola]
MSPPPLEKGKKPVTGDPSESDQDSRRRDGSPRVSDLETADDHLPSDEAQQEHETSETTLTESNPPRSRTRSRLSRFLISPFSGSQDGNSDEIPPKKAPGSAVPSWNNSRAQLPSVDHCPGSSETPASVQLPEGWNMMMMMMNKKKKKKITSVSDLASHNDHISDAAVVIDPAFLSKAEAGQKSRRAEPPVSKELDFGIFEPQFSSKVPAGLETEAVGELVDNPDKPRPSPMKATRPTTPELRSGRDFDGSSSNTENEVYQEIDDPSKRFQRVMVDRVMSSFMNWLDTKLKVKNEDGSLDPEQSLPAITHWGSGGQDESDIPPPPTSVPLVLPISTESASEFAFNAPVPSCRSDVALRSALPSPSPPPALGAPGYIPDKRKKVGVVPRLAMSQSRAPNALMAALPPSSPPTQLENTHLRPISSAPRAVVTPAAPSSAPRKRTARTHQTVPAEGASVRSSGKRSNKHDRPPHGNKEEEDGNSDGDGNRPPRAKLSKIHEDRGNGEKLACPFFKHNSRKYKNQRPCCGPGWDHVHRIKEHIYRKHSLPKFSCPRCSQPFETQADLQAHARSADACEVREPEFLDGITQDQEKRLRSRKKTSAKDLTEVEKWTQAYRILFPDVREREIPSPYYSTEDADTSLGGYEDYLRRELPPLVRRQLENEIDRELSFVEQGMKQKVIEIARNLQLTLFKGYQQLENQEHGVQDPPSVDAPASQTDGSTSSATDTSPSSMTSVTTPDIPDPLDLFSNYTHPDFDFTFLSEVPFPEEQEMLQDPSLDFGFTPSFESKQPATIQPGVELLEGQQLDMPYYELEGYHDNRGHMREAESVGYAP